MTMNLNDRPQETWDVKRENPDEASVSNNSNADSKKKRSWKKPKDKPMRPLSAYNMFFQNQRERIVAGKTGDPTPEEIQQSVIKMLTSKTRGPKRRQDRVSHGQISFGDLARTIAAKWKAIDPKLKAIYNHYAAQEKVRYKKEVVVWKEKKEREHDAAIAAKQSSLLGSSSSYNDSMMSMSTSSMSTSTSYNLSESINSLQGGGGMGMTDDVVQRQQDILRQQMGFIDSKPQARVGNGDVPREVPRADHGGDIGMIQFPNPIGPNGKAGMNMMGMDSSGNKADHGSLLDLNNQQQQQQRQIINKEELLMQLQQQQLQHLQQLQQARNATSRSLRMKTTDTFSQPQFPTPKIQARANPSNPKQLLQDQFNELQNITSELERLKEQERQMQQKISEHQNSTSTGMFDSGFGTSFNDTPNAAGSGNFNNGTEFTSGLNDTGNNFAAGPNSLRSTFDMEDRQRMVRRCHSGDTNIMRGHSAGANIMNGFRKDGRGQRRNLRRHHSMETGGNSNGFSPARNGFSFGGQKFGGAQPNCNTGLPNGMGQDSQGQNQDRRDSMAALLQLEDLNNMDRIGNGQRQQEQEAQSSLSTMLQQMQSNQAQHQDMGSMFNDLGDAGT